MQTSDAVNAGWESWRVCESERRSRLELRTRARECNLTWV